MRKQNPAAALSIAARVIRHTRESIPAYLEVSMNRSRVLPTLLAAAGLLLGTGSLRAQASGPRFINPPGLARPTGYTHVVVSSDGRTAYIAGQVAYDSTGKVVGENFEAQATRVFANLGVALASVGATFHDVMKTTTYITDLKNLAALREIRGRHFDAERPPANTMIPVSTLARPELLLEIEAVVAVPQSR
jgi:2-iminobutanoate/2-iminopropanoate deaminase